MCQTQIAYIDVRFSVHATEDPNKVIKAVHHVLPADYVDDIVLKKRLLKGHYGNPIALFETRIKKKKIVKAILENVFTNLNERDREHLLEEINMYVEEGSLYVRLDKQAASQGELKLCTADPLRLRIRFRKKRVEDIVKICQELGMQS